jgi:hypothetical protein
MYNIIFTYIAQNRTVSGPCCIDGLYNSVHTPREWPNKFEGNVSMQSMRSGMRCAHIQNVCTAVVLNRAVQGLRQCITLTGGYTAMRH